MAKGDRSSFLRMNAASNFGGSKVGEISRNGHAAGELVVGDSPSSSILDPSSCRDYRAGMAKRSPTKMTDQVRQAIDDSGLTRYRIACDTGIDESTLAKFYHGTRGLSLDNLDLLCEYLGLRIVAARKAMKGDT